MQKNTFTVKILSLISALLFSYQGLYAQLEVTGGQTPEQMIENFLGVGVEVDNVIINCPEVAYGTFDGTNSNIGIDNGILLTTGSIDNAVGPNNDSGAQANNGGEGDMDLSLIVDQNTFDACVLEFDFIPASNKLTFTYVFGSEEYLEWVSLDFNDVFAFFVSGPNPTGGLYENQNIALIPNTDIPVSIDNINDDLNTNFFVDNGTGEFPIDETTTVQYDGFTLPLSVDVDLVPCETYHLKLAIADSGDPVWDSGVFLEAGSLNTNIVTINESTELGTDIAVEACLNGRFTFTASVPLVEDLLIDLEISGSAENGVDYVEIPNSVTILAGEMSTSLEIEPIEDNIDEGTEDITIRFDAGFGCEGSEFTEATLFLKDLSHGGTVSVSPNIICENEILTTTVSNQFVAEGDVLTYLVHNSPDADVNMEGFTIFATSTDGNFTNDGGIPQNIPVYISTAIGDDDGTGSTSFLDFCLEVSPPAEAVFLEPIVFMIDEFCDLSTGDYLVSFQLQGGLPAFDNQTVYNITGDFAGMYGFGDNAITVTYLAGTENIYNLSAVDDLGCMASVVSIPFECTKNPIELLSFEGEVRTNGNLLQWITASESNNDYFELKRSVDGKNFESIEIVKSQGNGQNLQSYNFLDRNVPTNLSYYQLTQYDFNGLSVTFPVISLQRGEATNLDIIQVSPIPAKDFIEVSFMAANNAPTQILLYNTVGQVVFSQTLETNSKGVNTFNLDIQSLLSGVYLLQINNDVEQVSRRLVKE